MVSPQFSVRIPPKLDQRLKEYAAKNGTTKTEVMIAALANYLGCASEVPLTQRMVELEERLAILEAEVRGKPQVSTN